MTSPTRSRRALLAPVVALLALLGAPAYAVDASALAGPQVGSQVGGHQRVLSTEDTTEGEVAFVGRVTQVEAYEPGVVSRPVPRGRIFTVDVVATFGDFTLSSDTTGSAEADPHQAEVLTAPDVACETFPQGPETQRYLFVVKPAARTGKLFARDCQAITEYDKTADPAIIKVFGDKHFVDPMPTAPETAEPQPISFLCPETGEVLPNPADPAVDCDSLPVQTSTNRAAAPGLALVLIGFLGLFVLRRVRSTRRPRRRG